MSFFEYWKNSQLTTLELDFYEANFYLAHYFCILMSLTHLKLALIASFLWLSS